MVRAIPLVLAVTASVVHADPRPLKTIELSPDRRWAPSGIEVKRGATLTIVARGAITSGGIEVGPAGVRGTRALADPEARYPVSDAPPRSLVGRFGEAAPFAIGERATVTAPADAALWLGINDDQPARNRGHWTIEIWQGRLPESSAGDDGGAALEGSTWHTCAGAADTVQLGRDGQARMASVDCGGGRWRRDGARVTFACGALVFEGALDGVDLKGTIARRTGGAREPYCLRRGLHIAPGSQPADASAAGPDDVLRGAATRTGGGVRVRTVAKLANGACPSGAHPDGGQCAQCPDGTAWKPSGICRGPCPSGSIEWNDACYHCPSGSTWIGEGLCRRPCPAGDIDWAGACYSCRPGFTWAGDGWCKPAGAP